MRHSILLKNTLKCYIYNSENSNISIEANPFCLHQLFSKKIVRFQKTTCFLHFITSCLYEFEYIEKVHTKLVNTCSNKIIQVYF